MPYIQKEERTRFINLIYDMGILFTTKVTPGILNYLITTTCDIYLKVKGESYTTHNDIKGVLDNVKDEWYRRKIAPYEDIKIKENGDIF